MKKLSTGFIAFFSILFLFSCSPSKKATQQDIGYIPFENALLWEISGNGLEQPSYVYGTVHLIDKDEFFLPKGTMSALEKSQEIVFEVDLAEMNDLGSQMSLLTKAYMNDGITLKDLVSAEEYKEIGAFFEKMGLPLFFFERMKPMFLSVLASMDGDMSTMQTKMTSYEFELMDLAKMNKMESSGLETLDFQIGLFDSIPYEAQADMLLESIRTQKDGSEGFDEMVKMYKSQNINSMLTSIGEEEGIGDFEELLLTKRNQAWIPQIEEKVVQRSTFFAVGAGHLAGENGVLWLLKQKGYALKPLSIDHGAN